MERFFLREEKKQGKTGKFLLERICNVFAGLGWVTDQPSQ
jgi:hypothetical protein